MTTVQRVAQVFGIVFLLIAVLGFVQTGGDMTADMETAPRLFGLFAVNALHNGVHLLFGIWGLLASRSWDAAKSYCQIAGVVYIVLAVMGFVVPETFGLIPIGGNDIWLHTVLGLALAYFGFRARPATVEATTV